MPRTIANSPYVAEKTTGRKVVELSNGWVVAALKNNTSPYTLYFYVSKDKGLNWIPLCYYSGGVSDYAIVSRYTTVYLVTSSGHYLSFEATSVQSADLLSSAAQIISGTIQHVGLAIDNVQKKIYASFGGNTSDSSTIEGVINTNNSVTWGSEQRTFTHSLDNFFYFGTVPVINYTTSKVIYVNHRANYDYPNTYNHHLQIKTDAAEVNTMFQSGPESGIAIHKDLTACSDKLGRLFLAFTTNQNNAYYQVRLLYSDDGGTSWTDGGYVTSSAVHKDHASITCDKNNTLYIVYREDSGAIKRVSSSDRGATWSSPVTIGNGTYPNTAYDSTFSSLLVSTVFNTSTSSQYDYIYLNVAPGTPSQLSVNHFDARESAVFAWRFNDDEPNDTQKAYQMEIIDGSSLIYTSGMVSSAVSQHTLPANTLTNPNQYQWRVKTWDSADVESPWSNYSSFFTSQKPTVSITNLSEGETFPLNLLTLEWVINDPENEGQSAYRVQLTDLSDNVLYDTEKVASITGRKRKLDYILENDTDYKVKLTLWDTRNVASSEEVVSFHVAYSTPATPLISVYSATGHVVIEVDNPVPVEPQPEVTSNQLFKKIDGEWVKVSENTTFYRDYEIACGEPYQYKSRAVGSNGIYVDSESVTISSEFSGVWLHEVNDPEGTVYQFKYDGGGRSSLWEVEGVQMQFAGRKNVVTQTTEFEHDSISFTLDLVTKEEESRLASIVKSGNIVCYRDRRGRLMYGVFLKLPVSDERYGQRASLELTRIDYKEGV